MCMLIHVHVHMCVNNYTQCSMCSVSEQLYMCVCSEFTFNVQEMTIILVVVIIVDDDIFSSFQLGRTPAHRAAENGHIPVLRFLGECDGTTLTSSDHVCYFSKHFFLLIVNVHVHV